MASPSTDTQSLLVSRDDLAASRTVHELHGVVLLLYAIGGPLAAAAMGANVWLALPALIVGSLSAAWILRTTPPPLGSARRHLVVATAWVQPALMLPVFLPAAAPVLAGFGCVAPLAGFGFRAR